jgi:hypothetical protein
MMEFLLAFRSSEPIDLPHNYYLWWIPILFCQCSIKGDSAFERFEMLEQSHWKWFSSQKATSQPYLLQPAHILLFKGNTSQTQDSRAGREEEKFEEMPKTLSTVTMSVQHPGVSLIFTISLQQNNDSMARAKSEGQTFQVRVQVLD